MPVTTLETELQRFLVSHPSLRPLVGARVYPAELPKGTALPALTFQRISMLARVGSAVLTGRPHVLGTRVQLDCWARNYEGLLAVGEQVVSLLEGYQGPMGRATVQLGNPENISDVSREETGLWRRTIDLIFWYERL